MTKVNRGYQGGKGTRRKCRDLGGRVQTQSVHENVIFKPAAFYANLKNNKKERERGEGETEKERDRQRDTERKNQRERRHSSLF